MKKQMMGLAGLFALGVMTSAAAGGAQYSAPDHMVPQYPDAGPYVSLNAGYGKFDYPRPSGATTYESDGFSWNVNGGYQFNQYLALEGGYTQFHRTRSNAGVVIDTIDSWGLVAKLMLPFKQCFVGFARFGGVLLDYRVVGAGDARRWVPLLGLGLGYRVTPQLSLEAQGVTTFKIIQNNATLGNTPATYAFYAGASYLFNFI